MTVEQQIREALIAELQRQAEASEGRLRVEVGETQVQVEGPIEVDDLVMVILGSVAGGP